MSEAGTIATPPASASGGGRPRGQVGLADLMLWVFCAGVAAAAYRASGPALPMNPTRFFRLCAALLAIFLGMALLRQAVAFARRRGSAGEPWLAAVTWRLAVMALLGVSLSATVRLLGGNAEPAGWFDSGGVRLALLPLAMTFTMVGVLAGLSPRRDGARVRRPRMAWLSVVWAAVSGVAIAANGALIPYLVLIAIQAVRNARSGPASLLPPRPNVDQRILSAGTESIPVLACCLLLALLIARELRRPTPRNEDSDTGWLGPRALLAVAAASGVGAAWLLWVTIPALDECLAEGFCLTVNPLNAAIIVFGFAGLALGIAARSANRSRDPGPDPTVGRPPTPWLRIVRDGVIALVLLDVILARVVDWIMARRSAAGSHVPGSWMPWVGWSDAAFARFPPGFRDGLFSALMFDPSLVFLVFGQAWIAWRVVRLLIAPVGDEVTPLDACLGDRRTFGRFLVCWFALTVLMTAALPTFFLAGLGLLIPVVRVLG